jgi:hypothetical protein
MIVTLIKTEATTETVTIAKESTTEIGIHIVTVIATTILQDIETNRFQNDTRLEM